MSLSSYRVEVSPNNRAGCKDTLCKQENVKVMKGELRFGSWVEIKEHGSWAWKHWGCVSGKQIEGLREGLDNGDGTYDFDKFDGYDELGDHPDIQAKIRRCIEQGHIDPEDFKGDPEYNVLGQKGIRGRSKKPKVAADADEENGGDAEAHPSTQKTPAKKGAKRGRKAKAEEDEEDEEPERPVKKAKKAKAAVKGEDEEDVKPAKSKKATAKAKSHVKAEASDEEEEDVKPAKRKTAATKTKRKVKTEASDDDEAPAAPQKGKRNTKVAAAPSAKSTKASKRAVAPKHESEDEEDQEEEPLPKPTKRKAGRRSSTKE